MAAILRVSTPSDSTACLVFLHGLGGDPMETWKATMSADTFWPRWLAELFPDVTVVSLGYDASPTAWLGTTMPISDRAVQLLASMEAQDLLKTSLIFVAHSLGGLIVKQMIRVAETYNNEAWRAVAQQTLAVVFLATPHAGSPIAGYLGSLGRLLRLSVSVRELEANAAPLRDLNLWYRNNARRLGIQTRVFFEVQQTSGVRVVDESSSDPGIEGVFPVPVDKNHMEISKPNSREDLVFTSVVRLVRDLTQIKLNPERTNELSVGNFETSPPESEAREFSTSLRQCMADFHRHIEILTQEQYRVIRQLGPNRRVRVVGCAGSGKTLVAAEKSVRLARAGLRILLLCHSPLLAQHITGLTRGTTVEVWPFGDWVRHLAGAPADITTAPWTNYEEPEPKVLEIAFDTLSEFHGFDAVIVDEGQDFRPEWWVLVEGALAAPETGILYIFHDDHQALLPHRAAYPVAEPVLDLSRNCRNSGRVFNLVRYFHKQAPEPELPIVTMGHVWLEEVSVGRETMGLGWALMRAAETGLVGGEIVVLLGGGLRVATWQHLGSTIDVSIAEPWQSAVLRYYERAILLYDQRGLTMPRDALEKVRTELHKLGDEPLPTKADVELVRAVAGIFGITHGIRRRVLDYWQPRNYLRWHLQEQQLRLRRRDPAPLWAAEIIMSFEREDWLIGLPQPDRFRLVPGRRSVNKGELPVFDLAAFKGLEADMIILVVGGHHPMRLEETYVGISRARFGLAIVDCGGNLDLPPELLGPPDYGRGL